MSHMITIPAKPTFYVKRSIFVRIVDSIPKGKLSTRESIIDFLKACYSAENIDIPDFAYNKVDEYMSGIEHPWWRLVSKSGLIQEIPHLPYTMQTCKEKLESEGHTIVMAPSGVSYKVLYHRNSLFNLNELRSSMPPRSEADYYGGPSPAFNP